MLKRLVYIRAGWLPSQQANGVKEVRIAEAFAQLGLQVTLYYVPSRFPVGDIFDYYGVRTPLLSKPLPRAILPLGKSFSWEGWRRLPSFVHAFLWAGFVAAIIRREKADLYYTMDSMIAFWLVRLGLPTVYEADGEPQRGQRWLLRRIAHSSPLRLVVAITAPIKDLFLAMGFPEGKVIALSNGVDLGWFENLPSKEECRRRLHLQVDRAIIGYIGRFQTLGMEKGIPELIAAMASLPSLNSAEPLLLCVGGPTDAVPAYLNLARRLGLPEERLRFMDYVPHTEVPYWIRALDLAIEPFPNTEYSTCFRSPMKIFEYMAAGVPIVATDLQSIRGVLRHGENAWLVAPDDSGSLAEGIGQILKDPGRAERLAAQARLDVSRYTWRRRSARILQLLDGSTLSLL